MKPGYSTQLKKPIKEIRETHSTPVHRSLNYAGFWVRFVAWCIDALILCVICVLFSAIFGLETFTLTGLGMGLFGFFHFVLWWLYFSFMESSRYQATLGKLALGLRVTDIHGARLNFLRATGRYFSKFLSVLTLGIGFIMIGLTDNKQGLHDRIADTLVIRS